MSKKMDVRKVQLTGKSTYIVSLPRRWVDDVNLKRGETLNIFEQSDKSLLLVPKDVKKPEKITEISVKVLPKEKPPSLVRKIVSLYLVGYNTIRLNAEHERMTLEQREKAKDFVRRMLVGTEIVADSKNEMVLQVLLSYPELPVTDALRRIAIIATSMHKDAIYSLKESDNELAEEVVRTDDEVDRFNFYIVRQLKAAVADETILKEIGLDNARDCLGYRLVTKSVERVSDHAVNIAKNSLAIKKPIDSAIFEVLAEMSSLAIAAFEDSINSFFGKDYDCADEVIERKGSVDICEEKAISQILEKKYDAETTSSLRLIVESIRRTAEYGSDIAEIVLNLTALNKP